MGRERGVMECVETHGKGLEAEGSMGRVKRVSMARAQRVRRRQSRG